MLKWHSELPRYSLARGFNYSLGNSKVETQAESGELLQRKRALARQDKMKVQFHLTRYQFEIFNRFYEEDLDSGTKSFLFPSPVDRRALVCRILGSPSFTPLGSVDFSLSMVFVIEREA